MLLISPYIVINRMAAWADHTAVLEEAIPQQDKLKAVSYTHLTLPTKA